MSQLKILGYVSWAKRCWTKKENLYNLESRLCVSIKDITLGKFVNMFIRY